MKGGSLPPFIHFIFYLNVWKMGNFVELTDLPVIESKSTDTVICIKQDGELFRGKYYTNAEIDEKINKVRSDTVDLLEEANKMLSNI